MQYEYHRQTTTVARNYIPESHLRPLRIHLRFQTGRRLSDPRLMVYRDLP